MGKRFLIFGVLLALGAATALGLRAGMFRPDAGREAAPAPGPGEPTAGPRTPGEPAGSPPAAEPIVPLDLPTPPPGLDRTLAADYRRALEGRGIRVRALTITDARSTGGVRRAEVVYQTATDGSFDALRPEIVRIVGPGVNPKLALDQIVIRPVRPTGSGVVVVTVTVMDADRWLKAQIGDAEFYRRWTVRQLR